MALDFPSPRQRASTLAMQISPLGIVELSEEEFEFEVHAGPRMQRYANAAAFYDIWDITGVTSNHLGSRSSP